MIELVCGGLCGLLLIIAYRIGYREGAKHGVRQGRKSCSEDAGYIISKYCCDDCIKKIANAIDSELDKPIP